VPVTDAILSRPFIVFILYFLYCFFLFILFQGLTRGHYLGMVTKDDSVTHKYFHRGATFGVRRNLLEDYSLASGAIYHWKVYN
jgi:hypothetical protein